MIDRPGIITRLKELRRKHNFSQAVLSEKLCITQAAYSHIEANVNAVSVDHLLTLSKVYNVTVDFLLTGNKNLIIMNTKNGFLPLINAKAHAGFLKGAHEEEVMDDFEYYRIPGYNPTKDSVLIEIEGKSMQPTINEGDVLICQNQKNLDYVIDGSVAIIVTDDEFLLTRLFKHEDHKYFKMLGDNTDEENKKEIKKSKILKLLLVLGKVSTALIPHKELAFKGKLRTLEESLDSLNKEVFKISKFLNTEKEK
ncbi:MAG TPA: LexA family transcriptional regulator [Gillisia sp.]|nr:LexA family transcriptional regulator [Gillisia sp.]